MNADKTEVRNSLEYIFSVYYHTHYKGYRKHLVSGMAD